MAIKRENIYKICGFCNGDGIITKTSLIPPYPVIDIPCYKCFGKGGHLWGYLEKDEGV